MRWPGHEAPLNRQVFLRFRFQGCAKIDAHWHPGLRRRGPPRAPTAGLLGCTSRPVISACVRDGYLALHGRVPGGRVKPYDGGRRCWYTSIPPQTRSLLVTSDLLFLLSVAGSHSRGSGADKAIDPRRVRARQNQRVPPSLTWSVPRSRSCGCNGSPHGTRTDALRRRRLWP